MRSPSSAGGARRRWASTTRKHLVVVAVSALAAAGCGTPAPTAAAGPGATVVNCGVPVAVGKPPERVLAVFHPAIEMMHALGLSDRIVASAFLDSRILPEYAEAQARNTYLDGDLNREFLARTGPDFVLSAFNDAFTPELLGSRAELAGMGIGTWVFDEWCPAADGQEGRPVSGGEVSMETTYGEIGRVGALFGVPDRANALIERMRGTVAAVQQRIGRPDPPVSVAVVGSVREGRFQVQGGSGITQDIVELAGARNVFADLPQRQAHVGAEELVRRSPDVIVLIPCCGADLDPDDPAASAAARAAFTGNPALSDVPAVAGGRFAVLPFPAVFSGVRNADAVDRLARVLYPEKF